jgi:Ca2+-binding EF-hand superfamily protein
LRTGELDALRRIFQNADVARLKRKFDNADDSGDGQISVDEFQDHYKDFFGKKGDTEPASNDTMVSHVVLYKLLQMVQVSVNVMR